jgi:(E)-2-((N-methylformamido)methylene)succinate hydrolase
VTPIVLIHGVGMDHTMWNEVAAAMSSPITTYDLLGHGGAPALPCGSTIADFVDQLDAIAPSGSVDLVGFSLGALIAQAFTLAYPERVRRLVLLSGVFNRSPDETAAILERVADVRDGGYLANVATAIDRWFSADFAAARPDMLAAVTQRLATNDVGSYASAYEVFGTADHDLAQLVANITCPTLAVTGERDPRSTPAMTHALAARVRNGRAVIVPGVRHLLPLEVPSLVAEMIESFLKESHG